MSKRPPNALETKLHQAVLSSSEPFTPAHAEKIIPDVTSRKDALNYLLSVGLLKALADAKKNLTFKAIARDELAATQGLNGEEQLVLSHIRASQNEGIWTKHLKAKTNLHQTIIDRCLKTLTQKQLIKRVPSVQHPTRKLYMLMGLEPSVALTGGPWYTDNELDTEFIDTLMKACFKVICDSSFPKRAKSSSAEKNVLYPISHAPQYPSAAHIRNALKQARLTPTELSVDHVETLLNVLVLDGDVEKIPAFGTSLWNPSNDAEDDESDEEETKSRKTSSKRKRKAQSDSEDERRSTKSNKKKKKRKKAETDTESSDGDSDVTSKSSQYKKKSSKRKKGADNSEAEPSPSESEERKKKRKKKKSKRKATPSDSSDSESSSGSDTLSEDEAPRKSKSSKKRKQRSLSPDEALAGLDTDILGGFVYKAIRQERLSLGWSQTPCSRCPSFEFCRGGGPVNPGDCEYYTNWLSGEGVEADDES